MIMGHVGVAFAAKWRWQRIPLGALLLATFAPDILRELLAVFLLPLKETNLYSHALPWSALLALGVGALGWFLLREREAFVIVSGVALSHIALDVLSGSKPLWVAGPDGLDLWRNAPVELLIECALLFAGWSLLRRAPGRGWAKHWTVPLLLSLVLVVTLLGSISQRPYATRCLASPMTACTDGSWLTGRWDTTPFW